MGLYLDTCSQHMWGDKFKMAGTGKTTIKSLTNIYENFELAEMFMSDSGRHFDNTEVDEFCSKWGGKHHVVAAYSPWINGLVEGTNRILLYILAHLCTLYIGEDGWKTMKGDNLPRTWPDHFDKAICTLNWRILPAIKFRPKEILLGLIVNTKPTPIEESASLVTPVEIDTHMAYVAQQWLDNYNEAIQHATNCKAAFDRRVVKKGGIVTFEKGQLVQAY